MTNEQIDHTHQRWSHKCDANHLNALPPWWTFGTLSHLARLRLFSVMLLYHSVKFNIMDQINSACHTKSLDQMTMRAKLDFPAEPTQSVQRHVDDALNVAYLLCERWRQTFVFNGVIAEMSTVSEYVLAHRPVWCLFIEAITHSKLLNLAVNQHTSGRLLKIINYDNYYINKILEWFQASQ